MLGEDSVKQVSTLRLAKHVSTASSQAKAAQYERLLERMEICAEEMKAVQNNITERPRVESDFVSALGEVRLFMAALHGKSSAKGAAQSIRAFASPSSLQALRESCAAPPLPAGTEHRRSDCLRAIEAIQQILQDSAWVEDLASAQQVPQTPLAAEGVSRGQAFEQAGEMDAALEVYSQASFDIGVSLAVCRAVIKLKALVGSEANVAADMEQLISFKDHVTDRLQDLNERQEKEAQELGGYRPMDPFKTMSCLEEELDEAAEEAVSERQPPDSKTFNVDVQRTLDVDSTQTQERIASQDYPHREPLMLSVEIEASPTVAARKSRGNRRSASLAIVLLVILGVGLILFIAYYFFLA